MNTCSECGGRVKEALAAAQGFDVKCLDCIEDNSTKREKLTGETGIELKEQ